MFRTSPAQGVLHRLEFLLRATIERKNVRYKGSTISQKVRHDESISVSEASMEMLKSFLVPFQVTVYLLFIGI